jgi:hypothetical protein
MLQCGADQLFWVAPVRYSMHAVATEGVVDHFDKLFSMWQCNTAFMKHVCHHSELLHGDAEPHCSSLSTRVHAFKHQHSSGGPSLLPQQAAAACCCSNTCAYAPCRDSHYSLAVCIHQVVLLSCTSMLHSTHQTSTTGTQELVYVHHAALPAPATRHWLQDALTHSVCGLQKQAKPHHNKKNRHC